MIVLTLWNMLIYLDFAWMMKHLNGYYEEIVATKGKYWYYIMSWGGNSIRLSDAELGKWELDIYPFIKTSSILSLA